jgi:hypothetical protein
VFGDLFVGEQQFSCVVVLGQFFLVWNEIVNPIVTKFAQHQPTLSHFLFAEMLDEPALRMNSTGNQMMLC